MVDVDDRGGSRLVVLLVLWKSHLWSLIHDEWGEGKDGVAI